MKNIVDNAQKQSMDSANNIQIVQPKDDNSVPVSYPQDDKLLGELPTANVVSDTASAKAMGTNNPAKPSAVVAIPSFSTNTNSNKINKSKKTQHPAWGYNSNEKPKSGPLKKRLATKTVIKKSGEKPKQKPKAVMQPKNDY